MTIQDGNVSGNLTDFPVYIDITADADIGDETRADGYDIRFTEDDGETLLKYERVYWTGGNGDDVTAHYYVKVPSILATGGATIYCYYGDADASDGEDAANVWDANYEVVLHMDDATATTVADSTSHGSTGTKKGAGEPNEVGGKIYKAQDFDEVDDHIDIAVGYNTNGFTIEMLVNPDVGTGGDYVSDGDPSNKRAILCDFQADNFNIYNGGYPTGTASETQMAATEGSWQHIAYTTDGTDLYGYKNGGVLVTELGTNLNTADMTGYELGNKSTGSNQFGGLIEEFRISSAIRSAAWFGFQWANWNEGDNELTWGSEETEEVGDYSLVIDAGSFAWSGQTVGLFKGSKIAIVTGAYTEAGQVVSLLKGSKIPIVAGSYALSGQGVSLLRDALIDIAAGSYIETGQVLTLLRDAKIPIVAGSFLWTGLAAILIYSEAEEDITVIFFGANF